MISGVNRVLFIALSYAPDGTKLSGWLFIFLVRYGVAMFGVLYFCCSVVLLLFAFVLKFCFTHPDLGRLVFGICFFFNVSIVSYHSTVLEFQHFLFYGHHPELLIANPSIIWVAVICIPLHAWAIPRNERLRWRIRNR